ncbi:Benzoyl-CoA reductase/2-hydroxyglutaryl-CoA dehydratase subunit, BcrC/BadD/HgdB [Thermanaerovibrio velox DSM 12556]|uniref:Benzoyl-CoA reductase/2-hydroxyglutaryl-CoA dehydratase subunit, BcrC/BadD/HgdB n=1 Tax=Thermanaerovibrio velox DSM 12556 TaxID=926567 RepID=H0UPU4_9BACT|nr:double-cubane-cluster-containing anaerobic reductase [Thermanaerovibrio velox]EHM10653.1 Benzoyl-CoA reductase/2-hydroxyglutaryl-CoA dehydratase subunit, BcrC/BadD/HgdB [Thermanaerovibrio velox DSM 12556]
MADYREMWSELGLDLALHDKLCAALPPLFEEAFLHQKDRPSGMDYFNMVIAEVHGLRIKELVDHKRNGGFVVGSFCVYVPEEIVLALGGLMVGLCAGSQFWVPEGEKVLPRNLCPLIKAAIGAKLSKTCPYFQSVDLVVAENTCDGKKKAWEEMGRLVPTHVMDLPNRKSKEGMDLWRSQVRELIKRLEDLSGRKLTYEGLMEGIRKVEAKREALRGLYETRKADPVPISGIDSLVVSQIAFYDDPERFTSMTNQLVQECRDRVSSGFGVFPKGTKRILLTGSPIVVPNWKVHHILETSGASVVVEENCTGTRYFKGSVDTSPKDLEGLIDALADRYMNGINCACFSPNQGRLDDVVELAREYKVHGVVDVTLSFCSTYQVEEGALKRRLKEEGIPLLCLETDYAPGDEGQLRTRVEAFLESL